MRSLSRIFDVATGLHAEDVILAHGGRRLRRRRYPLNRQKTIRDSRPHCHGSCIHRQDDLAPFVGFPGKHLVRQARFGEGQHLADIGSDPA